MNEKVNLFIKKHQDWSEGLEILRNILVGGGLEETVKWGMPTYTALGKNIVGLGAFKGYFGLWFFQGALLNDPGKKLMNAQTGKTKAMRQWRFRGIDEIDRDEILRFIKEAIQNTKDGKEIKPARNKTIEIPSILSEAFSQNPEIKVAFEQLSKTKRRELAEHIGSAKRIETKERRLISVLELIGEGKGLHDAYRTK